MAFWQGHDVYVQDCFVGADPEYGMPIRVVSQLAWHNLFARQLFIRPDPEPLGERVGEVPAVGITICRGLCERLGVHRVDLVREVGPAVGHRRRRLGELRVHHRHGLVTLERRHAGQQFGVPLPADASAGTGALRRWRVLGTRRSAPVTTPVK